jgi:hypothetical protein
MTMSPPTVELSVSATSEELALLAAAAQLRRMSLREYLRLQVMAAARAVARPGPADGQESTTADLPKSLRTAGLRPVFLP